MIKKKDYELIAEAYARIGTINECWEKMSPVQKSKVEDVLKSKSGYKIGDNAWSEDKKTVTLTHELGSDAERDIIVDDKGEEVVYVHSGPHNESIESQATFDPDQKAREFIDMARKDPTNHKAHGSLAACWYCKGGKDGIVPTNPHVAGSPAAKNWAEGFNEILKMDDEAGKKEVQAGEVHTTPAASAPGYDVIPNAVKESVEALEEKKMACGKGCHCEKCPKCPPKRKKSLEEAFAEVIEEAKKKHVFTKVEKAAEEAGYSKKAAEKIAGAQKSKMRKKGLIKENDQSPAGWLTEYVEQFKQAFANVESIGYGGDGISDEQFEVAVGHIIGSEWGDEAPKAKQALVYLLKGFYQIGIQDS